MCQGRGKRGKVKGQKAAHTQPPLHSLWQGSDAPTLEIVELPPHVSGSVSYLFLSDCRKKRGGLCVCVHV